MMMIDEEQDSYRFDWQREQPMNRRMREVEHQVQLLSDVLENKRLNFNNNNNKNKKSAMNCCYFFRARRIASNVRCALLVSSAVCLGLYGFLRRLLFSSSTSFI
jgi:hypothetical protein